MIEQQYTILHLTTSLDLGGAEQQLLFTIPRLTSFKHVIICIQAWGIIGDKLRAEKIPVYFIPVRHPLSWKAVKQCEKIIAQYKPDLMITYLPWADLFGSIWRFKLKIPRMACSLHSTMREWRYFPLVILNIITQWLVDHFFAVSHTVKNFYQKFGLKRKISVIYNGIDLTSFSNLKTSQTLPSLPSLPLGIPLLGYVAKLRKERGHKFLFSAIKILADKKIPFHLLLVGDGPYRSVLEQEANALGISSRLTFLGNRSDVPQILKQLTLYVHPSRYEGMSVALIEAMAAGCPIITTDIPENREIAGIDRPACLLSPLNDESHFADNIIKLLKDKELAKSYAKQAKEHSLIFSVEKTVQELEKAYIDVIEKK